MTSRAPSGPRLKLAAAPAEPDHTSGRLIRDDMELHVGVCSCGWRSGGYETLDYARHALAGHQRIERYRPTPRQALIDVSEPGSSRAGSKTP